MKKNKNIWISYAIIVLILLGIILFVLPDSLFVKKEDNKGLNPNSTNKSGEFPFAEYSKMIDEIKNSNYDYEFLVMTEDKEYKYVGSMKDGNFTGTFYDEDKSYTYTELNEYINSSLVDLNNLFSILEKEKIEVDNYKDKRVYTYKIDVSSLFTEVCVYTDLYVINKITVSNKNYQYVLNYSNISIK